MTQKLTNTFQKGVAVLALAIASLLFQNCSQNANGFSAPEEQALRPLPSDDEIQVSSTVRNIIQRCNTSSFIISVNVDNKSSKTDILAVLRELANPSYAVNSHGFIGYFTNPMIAVSFDNAISAHVILSNLEKISGVKLSCNEALSTQ